MIWSHGFILVFKVWCLETLVCLFCYPSKELACIARSYFFCSSTQNWWIFQLIPICDLQGYTKGTIYFVYSSPNPHWYINMIYVHISKLTTFSISIVFPGVKIGSKIGIQIFSQAQVSKTKIRPTWGERFGGRVTAPIKSTTFGWRNLCIMRTCEDRKHA